MTRGGVEWRLLAGLALIATLAFAALGVWQLDRRAWKHDLIARVEARVRADPTPLPPRAAWAQVNARDHEYRRVRLRGAPLRDRETLVQALTTLGGGFWVMTPFRTSEGVVLVNRGFAPPERRDLANRPASGSGGLVEVVGLLRMSEPQGGFLWTNDPQADRWYSRNVPAIARARGLSDVAPFFIDAERSSERGDEPVGGLTVVDFSDNHLVYAFTWFGLSALSVAAFWKLLRDGASER